VSDQQQYDEAEQGQQQEQAEPGWVGAGTAEDAYQAQLGEVVARHPELAEVQTAQQALATASHIAQEFGDPTLASHPMAIEIAHVLNGQQAAEEEQAAEAARPRDPAQEIIDAGGAPFND
jgi:hypothetical protein